MAAPYSFQCHRDWLPASMRKVVLVKGSHKWNKHQDWGQLVATQGWLQPTPLPAKAGLCLQQSNLQAFFDAFLLHSPRWSPCSSLHERQVSLVWACHAAGPVTEMGCGAGAVSRKTWASLDGAFFPTEETEKYSNFLSLVPPGTAGASPHLGPRWQFLLWLFQLELEHKHISMTEFGSWWLTVILVNLFDNMQLFQPRGSLVGQVLKQGFKRHTQWSSLHLVSTSPEVIFLSVAQAGHFTSLHLSSPVCKTGLMLNPFAKSLKTHWSNMLCESWMCLYCYY